MNLDGSLINWETRKGTGWVKGVKEERLVKAKVCIKAPTRGLALCVRERNRDKEMERHRGRRERQTRDEERDAWDDIDIFA